LLTKNAMYQRTSTDKQQMQPVRTGANDHDESGNEI
jgi:hypothetical protein